MAKKALTFTKNFIWDKETKGTHRMGEVDASGKLMDEGFLIGGLYLRKDQLDGVTPKKCKVTVEIE